MKKILAILVGLAAGVSMVHAQGYITAQSTAADITTNTSAFGSPGTAANGYTSVVSGKTVTTSGAFDYALLWSSSDITDGATDAGWTQATQFSGASLGLDNYLVGGSISGAGTSSGIETSMPVGAVYVMLVGWSADLGSSWSGVESDLANNWNNINGPGYFFGETGVSTVTTQAQLGGDPAIFPAMFPNGSLTMYDVQAVPEPATLALAGLGGLSMLFLRRRKA